MILHDAKILLDGEVVGFGDIRFSVLPAGTHAVTIIYGTEQRNEIIVLDQFDSITKTYLYNVEVEDTITIQTHPSDSKVYINSEWVGNSPVVIAKPLFVEQLEVRAPGYLPHRTTVSNISESLYNVIMEPVNPIPLEDRIDLDRRKFYNSFSLFAISLAAPIIFNGFYINELNAHSTGGTNLSPDGQAEYQQNHDLYYFSYLGTAAISTGLGIFSYIRLRQYLDTASEYHER